jgi:arsenite methyltransferase
MHAPSELAGIPEQAVSAALGCGNPSAMAGLCPGEIVLDLGAGGGIDVLLAARRVGRAGKVYGLDRSQRMLSLAQQNKRQAGAENVEFVQGELENIPLRDASFDVLISNNVVNVCADKDLVLNEAFRVLRPGGRIAICDVVMRGEVRADIRHAIDLWVGCVAGALEESEYRSKMMAAGFEQVVVEPIHIFRIEAARPFLEAARIDPDALEPLLDGKFMTAMVGGRKPIGAGQI